MKRIRQCHRAILALGGLLALGVAGAGAHQIEIQIEARWGAGPVALDSMAFTNGAGPVVSVTRLDFLLSGFGLHRHDGVWLAASNGQAFVSLGSGRTAFTLAEVPPGRYEAARFLIGLTPELNHADPAQFGPDHPLNPLVNGLHWGWQGGYVFLALEGLWRDARGESRGYSFHLATDPQVTAVEVPLSLDLSGDRQVRIPFQVDKLFSGRRLIALSGETATTHSRPGDPLADWLRENLGAAFTAVEPARAIAAIRGAAPPERGPTAAPSGTPYRFTYSSRFPRPALPVDNPLTGEGVELGRRLFFDPRLSRNGGQSCASCHQPEAAFSDAGKQFSRGVDGRVGDRNAMPLFNLAWKSAFFWDGRARALRDQVLMPIENEIELHESLANVVAKLAADPGYGAGFERAFGTREVTTNRLARALEQFLLTLVACDSKFDRALRGEGELTAAERRGLELFVTEHDPRQGLRGADCFHCHGGPLFVSAGFVSNGLDAAPRDPGRASVTGRDGDRGRFATPSLRNVARTAPYMHDGRFATLEEVVEHYSSGVKRSAALDPNLAKHPEGGLGLSAGDKAALVAFLKTLTEEGPFLSTAAGLPDGKPTASAALVSSPDGVIPFRFNPQPILDP